MHNWIVIDFDSTFTQVEALEELVEIVMKGDPNRAQVYKEMKAITDLGMAGDIGFNESLRRRLALIRIHRDHLQELVKRLKKKVSSSISRNKSFFQNHAGQIYILSLGFREFIEPVVAAYGISSEHVLANTFLWDEEGYVVGFDNENVLAHSKGKSTLLRSLNLPGNMCIIGDSYTDYEAKESGVAHSFYAFTENILREGILAKADHVLPNFDEFLYVNHLPMTLSYPKNRIKVLLLENIHSRAAEIFEEEGYQVETVAGSLTEAELCQKIEGVSLLGIRSKTQLTPKVLASANRLMAVGAFCIGTNQMDLPAAANAGVVAFNAPYSNTRSVVELAIGEIITLIRKIPYLNHHLHLGKWIKSAAGSHEVRGKKLGIIGYGNIGSQLSVIAEALGMEVYYYDVVEKLSLGNAHKCKTLAELLKKVDVVTLHVDGRKDNSEMIGEAEFKLMKKGVIFLNLSRGHVVDLNALVKAVKSGKVAGAGIDVYPYEPLNNQEEFLSELRGLDNVILTPHIGGSTEEAQENIAEYVPARLIEYINTGNTFGSVNFPVLQLPHQKEVHRLIHIHQNVPGILAQINQILATHKINIEGQYLKTNEQIGYVITDINKAYSDDVLADLRNIPHTIKFRVLY